ncbi:MAG: 4-amino-4-deoxy-L-arabinose transferase [Aeromicrobium sp.]
MNRHRYAELSALIAGRQPACGTTTVIALDGPSGSGKTSLADGFAEAIGADVLHFDDVYPGWHGLEATPSLVRDGVLDRIAADEIGEVNRWAWDADQPGPALLVPPAPLLILDGVGSGAALIRPYLSLLLWVEAPLEVRRRRALARDGGAYEPFWDVWAEQEARHFAAEQTRLHADRIIDTGER